VKNEKQKKVFILNLSGVLIPELEKYFSSRSFKVIDPVQSQERYEWTHILTKDVDDFSLINKTYKTIEKDIPIISLSKIKNPQNFILCNGKLILDEIWMQSSFGDFILDKLFQGVMHLELSVNYPKFKEVGTFNIINPFSTGDYVDRLIQNAFDGDYAALSIRTYFDHLLMYVVGLKSKGKAGLPIEVSYGSFKDIFALQVHFYTDGLSLDDLVGSFSTVISKKSEDHILGIAVQSVDFFDFTFISQVNKVVITALWTRDEKIKFENRGLMFVSLNSGDPLQNLPFYGITSNLLVPKEIKDYSVKVELPGKEAIPVLNNGVANFPQKMAENISKDLDSNSIHQIIDKNLELPANNKISLKSSDEFNELLTKLKRVAEESSQFGRLSFGNLDVDSFIHGLVENIPFKDEDPSKIKFIKLNFEKNFRTGLYDFAKKVGKDAEELTDQEIRNFNRLVLPQLIKNNVELSFDTVQEMMGHLKTKLDKDLKHEFVADSMEKVFDAIKSPEDEMRAKNVLIDSLKDLISNDFKLSGKDELSEGDRSLLVKGLSKLLSTTEDKVQNALNETETSSIPSPKFGDEMSDNEMLLQTQIKMLNSENGNLRSKIEILNSEVSILKESRAKLAEINQRAREDAELDLSSWDSTDDNLADDLMSLLYAKMNLNSDDEAPGNHEIAQIVELLKNKEKQIKQTQFELTQRDLYFSKEMEGLNKKIKARDIMLSKAKDNFQILIKQKDQAIDEYRYRIDALSANATLGNSQMVHAKDLEKQNQNLQKMLEMYKSKINVLTTNADPNKLLEVAVKQELKRMDLSNTQLKSQLESLKKELQKHQERAANDNHQITLLMNQKLKLELEIKRLSLANKRDLNLAQNITVGSAQTNQNLEIELRKALNQTQILDFQLRETTLKLKDAEKKLSEFYSKSPSKMSSNEEIVKKAIQLEANVKKLSMDLIESKNHASDLKKEVNKLRQERVALQNQIDKFKKDLSRGLKGYSKKSNIA